jgi:hypothetical protein
MLRQEMRLAPLFLALLLTACIDDPLYPVASVTVAAVNLPPLTAGGVYELWLTYPSELARIDSTGAELPDYISIGRFIVDASGSMRAINGGPATFEIPQGYNPSLFRSALLTVEPAGATDAIPSAILLAGDFERGAERRAVDLELVDPRAFGELFDPADSTSPARRQGSFMLETPTTVEVADWMRGIWFALVFSDPRDTVRAGLNLPAQPSNPRNPDWRYAAWLTNGAQAMLLGYFDSPNNPDDNGPGPYAGSGEAYPFPGEDLVMHPDVADLRGAYGVVISLEPRSFALPAPLLPVLVADTIPDTLQRRESVTMRAPVELPVVTLSWMPTEP